MPKVKIDMGVDRFVIAELASNGFGPPGVLAETRVDLILDAYEYLTFKKDYEAETYRMMERDRENR